MDCDNYREDYECFFEAADRGYEEKRINEHETEIPSHKLEWLKSVKEQIDETDKYLKDADKN